MKKSFLFFNLLVIFFSGCSSMDRRIEQKVKDSFGPKEAITPEKLKTHFNYIGKPVPTGWKAIDENYFAPNDFSEMDKSKENIIVQVLEGRIIGVQVWAFFGYEDRLINWFNGYKTIAESQGFTRTDHSSGDILYSKNNDNIIFKPKYETSSHMYAGQIVIYKTTLPPIPTNKSIPDELMAYYDLLQKGAITQEEYNKVKEKLLK